MNTCILRHHAGPHSPSSLSSPSKKYRRHGSPVQLSFAAATLFLPHYDPLHKKFTHGVHSSSDFTRYIMDAFYVLRLSVNTYARPTAYGLKWKTMSLKAARSESGCPRWRLLALGQRDQLKGMAFAFAASPLWRRTLKNDENLDVFQS